MGLITIKIPQEIKIDCEIIDKNFAEDLIEKLRKNEDGNSELEVFGIWKNRFKSSETSEEIQRKWRKNSWKRS